MSTSSSAARAQTRSGLVADLIAQTREIVDKGTMERQRLDGIRQAVESLADRRDLWAEPDFPAPAAGELQSRYLIGSEGDGGITLYLNVMRSGKKIPPHDHTTWACIAAVEGSEHNTLYQRTDDGQREGHAELSVSDVVEIAPGQSLALMPDDIHSVEIRNDQVIRHLHFYGRPLETLSERKAYDLASGTYKIMSVGVQTKAGPAT